MNAFVRYAPYSMIFLSFSCPGRESKTQNTSTSQDGRYNIVLILADDIGYECIGAYGSTYSTPCLDLLADDGILYRCCYSQPLSTPTRVQLMTGQYNFRNYVEFGYMNPDETTFGNIARNAGYETCMVGKWQLGADKSLPGKFGFDDYCLWQLEKGRKDGAGSRYAAPGIECRSREYASDMDLYGPDVFNGYALNFIEKNRDRPFFLYYSEVLVHSPFCPTPDSGIWKQSSARLKNDPANFSDMVSYMDKNVGKILDKLKELDIYDKTVVIFIGDNGTHRKICTQMSDGTVVRGGKGLMTDAGTHVPMIVRYPGSAVAGSVSDALVDMTDFFPTIAEIVGYDIPEDEVVDGISLVPQFRGDKYAEERKWVFCHYDPLVGGVPELSKSGRFIRNHRFKLYHDGRFYDLKNDPEEKCPLDFPSGNETADNNRSFLYDVMSGFPAWKPGDKGAEKKGNYNVANQRNKQL